MKENCATNEEFFTNCRCSCNEAFQTKFIKRTFLLFSPSFLTVVICTKLRLLAAMPHLANVIMPQWMRLFTWARKMAAEWSVPFPFDTRVYSDTDPIDKYLPFSGRVEEISYGMFTTTCLRSVDGSWLRIKSKKYVLYWTVHLATIHQEGILYIHED